MPKVKEVLFSSEEIEEKVREMGAHITEDYRGEEPLLVGILRGAASIKYVGFEVPDVFVVGYGIDYAGAYRNLRNIYSLEPETTEG